jgi:hypothetical protein
MLEINMAKNGVQPARRRNEVRLLTLLILAYLAAPDIGSAQTIASAPLPDPPPPLRLFKETVPESSGRSIESLKSTSWWEPPARNSEIPRFGLGQTVAFNTAGGLALTAGFFGRRADPLPLFLSQSATREMQRYASNSVTDPSFYRLRWDVKFGVAAPVLNGPKLKVDAIGEVFIPVSGPTDSKVAFPTSRTFRLGGALGF